MKKHLRYPALLLLIFLLISCRKEEKNIFWYMQHPMVLKQEMVACEADAFQQENKPTCKMIMQAAMNMDALVNQQQEDPEKFGQGVLEEQERFSQLESEVINARNTLNQLKNSSPAEIRLAEDNLAMANHARQESSQKIKVLLAVIGLGSPD